MVDIFVLSLTHGLLGLAAWRIMMRDDLDIDPGSSATGPAPKRGGRKNAEA